MRGKSVVATIAEAGYPCSGSRPKCLNASQKI